MFSQDDDGEQRVALFVVFGLIALVISLVLAVGVTKGTGFMKNHRGATAGALQTKTADSVPAQVAPAEVQAAADAASVKVEQGVVKFYFASGKADLAAGAAEAMADLVKGAQAGRKLAISGFHDSTGDATRNAELAKQRALAVRDALMAAGVAESQIDLKKPEQVTGSGNDAEARRVEITME